jgi:uncharacterized protein
MNLMDTSRSDLLLDGAVQELVSSVRASSEAWELEVPGLGSTLSIILKLVGERCNLDCLYCYEKRRPYAGNRLLTAKAVRDLLRWTGPRPLSVELHGGEPLLTPRKVLREILSELRAHPAPLLLRLQTNATLLDLSWLEFFAHEWPDLQVGISIDGDEVANSHRLDLGGRSSHDAVGQALALLRDHGIEVGVIAVVTRSALGRARESLLHFAAQDNVRVVKFAPCFDIDVHQGPGPVRTVHALTAMARAVAGYMPWAISPKEYAGFLIETWRFWREEKLFCRFLLEPHATIVRKLAGASVADCHSSPRKCAHVLTLYPDGRLGSCDELDRPTAYLGDIAAPLPAVGDHWRVSRVAPEVEAVLDECNGCSHQQACGGGCPAVRLRLKGLGLGDAYCGYRKRVIDFIASELRPS